MCWSENYLYENGHFNAKGVKKTLNSNEDYWIMSSLENIFLACIMCRDGQNHQMLMILKSKSIHLNKGYLKSDSKSFWKWWFENQNHIENQMILKIILKYGFK